MIYIEMIRKKRALTLSALCVYMVILLKVS
jgi:hypothetical protein